MKDSMATNIADCDAFCQMLAEGLEAGRQQGTARNGQISPWPAQQMHAAYVRSKDCCTERQMTGSNAKTLSEDRRTLVGTMSWWTRKLFVSRYCRSYFGK